MKKLMIVIGLAAAALLAVPTAGAADLGAFDVPSLTITTSNITADVHTNASVLLFAAAPLRVGITLSGPSGDAVWLQMTTSTLLGASKGRKITFGTSSTYIPGIEIGKGMLRIQGNSNATMTISAVQSVLTK